MRARHPLYRAAQTRLNGTTALELRSESRPALQVLVIDRERRPLPGAHLLRSRESEAEHAFGSNSDRWHSVTDEEGHFAF